MPEEALAHFRAVSAAVAVPVFDAQNQFRYAITVLYRTGRKHDPAALRQHALRAASVGPMLSGTE